MCPALHYNSAYSNWSHATYPLFCVCLLLFHHSRNICGVVYYYFIIPEIFLKLPITISALKKYLCLSITISPIQKYLCCLLLFQHSGNICGVIYYYCIIPKIFMFVYYYFIIPEIFVFVNYYFIIPEVIVELSVTILAFKKYLWFCLLLFHYS